MTREAAQSVDPTRYWDGVGAVWADAQPDALWRSYCDHRNATLVARWLRDVSARRLLKTDTFDEAVSTGLFGTLRTHASSVAGIDVSPAIARAARGRHPAFATVAGDVRALPFTDAVFDVAVSISTLDHFDSRECLHAALGEIRRVLRPGGGLLITIDNETNPVVALRNRLPFGLLHRLGLVPYRVGRSCGGRAFGRLLASQGFDVECLTYVEHCPRLIAVRLARLLARMPSENARAAFIRVLEGFERLEGSPLRAFTGHYVAAWAVKR